MRWVLALLLALCVGNAWAASPLTLDAPPYVGLSDINGALYVYRSTRCMNAAYAGNVLDAVDSATGNTTGTRLFCSNGQLLEVNSSSACTFVTGNACSALATTCASGCRVSTEYDQVGINCGGPCNATMATNANRPTIVLACQGGLICLSFNGGGAGSACLVSPNISTGTVPQPFTVSWVAKRNGGAGTRNSTVFGAAATNNVQSGWSFAAGSSNIFAGTATQSSPAITDGVWHTVQNVFNGASSTWMIDGVSTTVSATPGANGLDNGSPMNIGCNSGGTNGFMDSFWLEDAVWASDKTSTRFLIDANQHSYWKL